MAIDDPIPPRQAEELPGMPPPVSRPTPEPPRDANDLLIEHCKHAFPHEPHRWGPEGDQRSCFGEPAPTTKEPHARPT